MTVENILNELPEQCREAFVRESIAKGVPIAGLIIKAITDASDRLVSRSSLVPTTADIIRGAVAANQPQPEGNN